MIGDETGVRPDVWVQRVHKLQKLYRLPDPIAKVRANLARIIAAHLVRQATAVPSF